ncbi:MAG: PTS sugar transporter subunit IIB [Propionibacteriaceae bacterium]|nr:PTS sugar transporter subunit IIB [Propionibacteriaceae bacterium]
MTTRVLVVCGGGASSGFLAQSMRKEAKKADVDLEVSARSETEVDEYLDRIDVLLVGPHLAYMEDKLRAKVEPHGIKVALLPHKIYGRLDGAGAFAIVESLTKAEG